MNAYVLPPLAVNNKSEQKVNSLPLLGFELVIIGMLAHLSNHSTRKNKIAPGFRMYLCRKMAAIAKGIQTC
jgi:hypothetical protein